MTDREKDLASDLLIREVDEDLRREQYAKLWQRYGNWLVGAAIGIVVVVAGYQGWQGWQSSVRQDEAGRFGHALSLADAGQRQDAAMALALLGADARTGYATVARLTQAAMLADAGDTAAAVTAYETVAGDSSADRIYRDLATLKAVLLTLDSGDATSLTQKLAPLAASGPWRHLALEATALLAVRGGDQARARDILGGLADDATAPEGVRARAAEMLAALGADGKARG